MCNKFLVFVFFTISSVFCFAQVDEQAAFQKFKAAREAYQAENFVSAAQLLQETKTLLGSTNIRIQPMLINSLVKIEDWRQAKVEISTYFGLNPDPELVEYLEIADTERIVNERIGQEESLYKNAKSNKSVSQYQQYLDTYPYGKYRSEVSGLLTAQNDENAWTTALNTSSTSAYWQYLDKYPNGAHADEARNTIRRWDDEAFEKAKTDGSQTMLNTYLSNYPKGTHRDEARNLLSDRIEYDMYMTAKNGNYIENYEAYINQYPNGKYASEVNNVISETYFKFGNDAFSAKQYSIARQWYQRYLDKYPMGYHVTKTRQQITKCNRKLNQTSASFMSYSYEAASPVGFTFGYLNKNAPTVYANFKLHPQIFTGFNVLYEIDDAGVTDSPWAIKRNNIVKEAEVGASLGLLFKVAYPIWMYIGGGAAYNPVYEEVTEYSTNGSVYEVVWMRNSDQTQFGFYPEAGLILKVGNALTLKGGGLLRYGEIVPQFGLGFQF